MTQEKAKPEPVPQDVLRRTLSTPPKLHGKTPKKKLEQWLQENAAAIHSYNEFVEEHGMVLDKYRLF